MGACASRLIWLSTVFRLPAYHRIEIELVHEMFCVVIFGLVGLVKMNPQIEDDVLMKVIEQTLRLDMAPLEAGEG